MTEAYDTTIPTQQQLDEQIRGVSFEQFMAMTDEEVDALHQAIEADRSVDGLIPEDRFMEVWGEAFVWKNFVTWRKYGVPDRNVSRDELSVRMKALVESRLSANPNYGVLSNEQYRDVPLTEKQIIGGVFNYLAHSFAVHEPPVITSYSLYNTLGLRKPDIKSLLGRGVLQSRGGNSLEGGHYMLTEPYYDHWLLAKCGIQPREAQQN